MDKNIGKKLDGRYEITELIGVGGMAEVYKGVDVIDNKTVAIKILKKEYSENEEFLRRFRNESKAIAVLSHPNIVKIYDVGFSEKIQYIVMEYIDGITLKEYIEEEKVLTWKDTVHFVIQILRALQHAHDKGIVHRDIKPQNIMMLTDGTIKVMDFGIAKFAREDGKTATDQAIGSVHYISPEQASGNVTDAKSDIYSVGAMMYEMLTGRKPFDSDNPVAIAVMHMHDIPERPRAINPDIPDGLEEVVLKAMEKAPEDRYQTTGEMIADIEAFKENPEISFGYYKEEEASDADDTKYFDAPQASVGDVQLEENVPVPAAVAAGAAGGEYQPEYAPEMHGGDPYDDEDDEEEEERSSLLIPVLTAAVVVVIIVAVVFVGVLVKDYITDNGKKADYSMPDLYNMDYNEAQSQWGNVLKFEIEAEEYNELEEGRIYEQSIDPDAGFNKGDTVKVKVSKGMEMVEVPKVSDMNQDVAKDQLTERGLKYEFKNTSDSDVKKGYVIKSEPAEGTQVHKGSTVVLYVSMGANADQIKVSDYTKKKIDDATRLAQYEGLKVVAKEKAAYEDEGIVVEQSIEKGKMVEEGTEIILYYSNGKDPDGEIPYTINAPDGASGNFKVNFVLKNEDNTFSTQTVDLDLPTMQNTPVNIKGSGESVNVVVTITNIITGQKGNLGTYTFNFADKSITTLSETIEQGFTDAGALQPATEEPTEAPTEATTEAPQQPQTQAPQQPQTQAPQPQTQAPTEAPHTEAPTEPPTEDEGDEGFVA